MRTHEDSSSSPKQWETLPTAAGHKCNQICVLNRQLGSWKEKAALRAGTDVGTWVRKYCKGPGEGQRGLSQGETAVT